MRSLKQAQRTWEIHGTCCRSGECGNHLLSAQEFADESDRISPTNVSSIDPRLCCSKRGTYGILPYYPPVPRAHEPRLPPNYRPTRSKIMRARLTLSETTEVRRGEGRLISGSRARRTAAMIAAAMTRVDFIRVRSCICSAQGSLHFTHQCTTDRTGLGPSRYESFPRNISEGR